MLKWVVKTFYKKDNIISFFAFLLSIFIILVDIFNDGFKINTIFEAILFILALLSISQIVERETRFADINASIVDLKSAISLLSRPLFIKDTDVVPFTVSMEESDEFFYTGGHLYNLLHTHIKLFEKWLAKGKSIRLILQDPEIDGLKSLSMPCVNYKPNVYISQINESLKLLRDLHSKMPKARFGVRVTNITPTQSVSIIDGNKLKKHLTVLHHLPDGEYKSAPFTTLDQVADEIWFNLFYERYYRYLWNNSRVIISHPDDKRKTS